jgi:3-hydroxyisobutyrate dehydrogenase-like beta-hydroxyacid dehydrogenase
MTNDHPTIGILHPGEMGISVAASAQNSGCTVYWVAQGRSAATVERADRHGLLDAGSLADLCAVCSLIVSVCPPHAAEDVADQVIAAGFRGLYLDANAIAPQAAVQIAQRMEQAGITLCGWRHHRRASLEAAQHLALSFRQPDRGSGGLFRRWTTGDQGAWGPEIGAASALKMCYAAYTKGATALLAAIFAAAEHYGVGEALAQQWDHDTPGFSAQTRQRVRGVTAKAWRFEGEMEEIAATLQAANLPGGFHEAAADIYHRLAHFKGAAETPSLEEVIGALQTQPGSPIPI